MSKEFHDNVAASHYRQVNYNKVWHIQGQKVLQDLNLENFSMLDLGSGNCEFAEIIRKKFRANITCLDYAESHLERAKKLGFNNVKCNFDLSEDVDRINETLKETFDIIVSFAVIEHIFDVDEFLATSYNLLKKDGFLLISTPNMAYVSHRIYSLFRGNLPVGEGHHIRFFDRRRLEQTLILNGFHIVKDYSFGKGSYYLDRTIGEKKNSLRALLIKFLFALLYSLSPRSYSSLMFLSKKTDIKPVGLDPTFRLKVYDKLSPDEKKKAVARLLLLRKQAFFDDHPGLRRFIDLESQNLDLL